jgi:SAM-dependent methyltransferase
MSGDVATRKAQTRAVFERVAPEYDLAGPGCFAHYGRRLVEVVGVEPGQRVLDVATGRGAVLFPAAERVGAAGTAIGIDLAEGMVRATGDEVRHRNLPASVRVMDAEQLDFPDASFDRVLCGFGVMFFPDLARALAECRRVLKPGGRLGVSTWRIAQADDLGAVIAQLGLTDTGDDIAHFRDPVNLERPLVAAGFAEVCVRDDPTTFRFTGIGEYWETARSTGLRRWLDRLDAAQLDRARAALAERLQPFRQSDGYYLGAAALLATATR